MARGTGKVNCPCCEATVAPEWEPCDGIWVCPICYEDIDNLVDDLTTEDRYIAQGMQDPHYSGRSR